MSDNQEKLNEQLFNVVADEKASDEAMLKKLKYMVRLGADVNTRLYGKSLLSKAIEKGVGAQVQNFLREKGANEWVISKEEVLEVSQGFWNDKGDLKSLEEIKELLKKGADVNAKDKYGWTALIEASKMGHLEAVKYLAQNGADVNASNKFGQTALIKAAIYGRLEVVKCLVELGADLEAKDKDGLTVLMKAANCGMLDAVKCLAECGADVNAKGGLWSATALIMTAEEGRLDVVKCLVELGADLEAKDVAGRTALMKAVVYGRLDMVKYLAEGGADLEAKDGDGQTALMFAARFGYIGLVNCLVGYGADLEAKDKDGRTVLGVAKSYGRDDCVKFLEKLQPKEVAKEPYEAKVEVLSEHKDKAKKEVLEGKAQDEKMEKGSFWQRIFGGRD